MTREEAKNLGLAAATEAVLRDGLWSVRKCLDQGTVYGLDELHSLLGLEFTYEDCLYEYDKLREAFFDGYESFLEGTANLHPQLYEEN